MAEFEDIRERVVIINGVSKAYAMTGWRIGFIAAPEWVVKGCNKLQGQYTSGPCSVSQKAAEAAYTGTQQPVEDMRKAFERRKNLIVSLAKEIPGLEVNDPQGAFYLFLKSPEADAYAFAERAKAHELLLVPGDDFAAPGYVRISYCVQTEQIERALPAFRALAEEYKL
jgi:aspartate aminotransferase